MPLVPDVLANDLTADLYGRLPEVIRNEDAKIGLPLKRFMAGVTDQAGAQDLLRKRFSYMRVNKAGTALELASDLVDPYTSDAAWIWWIAQILGVKLNPQITLAQQRDQLAIPEAAYLPGTETAIKAAAQSALNGTKFVRVFPRSLDLSNIGTGTRWDLLIVCKGSEVVTDVVAAINAVGARPAGHIIHFATFEASWATIQSTLPTWADWNGKSWRQIMETNI